MLFFFINSLNIESLLKTSFHMLEILIEIIKTLFFSNQIKLSSTLIMEKETKPHYLKYRKKSAHQYYQQWCSPQLQSVYRVLFFQGVNLTVSFFFDGLQVYDLVTGT